MKEHIVTVAASGSVITLRGHVPVARLLLVATEMFKPTRSDAEFHATLDGEQIRGEWDTDNHLAWSGYDYRSQGWITATIGA